MGDSILRGQEKSWAGFANYLTDTFKTQYGEQQGIFQALTSKFTDMIKNPQGFSQAALSALRGGSVEQISNQFNNARQSVQATQAARGDFNSQVKSGVNAQINGQIAAGQAGATASGLNNIEMQNEQLKQENQWKALSGLSGVAQMENPNGLAGAATSAAGAVGELGTAYFNTDQSGFLDKLGGSFATGLGGSLGKVLGGGGMQELTGSNNNGDN